MCEQPMGVKIENTQRAPQEENGTVCGNDVVKCEVWTVLPSVEIFYGEVIYSQLKCMSIETDIDLVQYKKGDTF